MVARSLTNAGKEVLLRLMNVSCNPQTVYKNTVVGSTSPVVNIIENKEQSNDLHAENIQSDTDVNLDHLKDLCFETSHELDLSQMKKAGDLPIKFQHIFSRTKDDFGRTSMAKHKINTENAKPTKQPSRRLPHHAADFVDKEVENMIDKGIVERSCSP